MLPRPSLVHEFFRDWAQLTSSFQHLVACSVRQLWFRACIFYIDPLTCHFVIPLLVVVVVWLHPLETSRQMCRITFNTLTSSEMSTMFMMRNTLLALDDFIIIDNTLDFLSSRACPCYGCNLLSSLYSVLPWSIIVIMSRMLWGLLHLLENLGMMILLTITILPWSSCCFQPGYQYAKDATWVLYF